MNDILKKVKKEGPRYIISLLQDEREILGVSEGDIVIVKKADTTAEVINEDNDIESYGE